MVALVYPYWKPGFGPREYWLAIRSQVQIVTSSLNGSIQRSQLPGNRLIARLVLRGNTDASDLQPDVEGFFAGLEGQAGTLIMPHLHRLQPRGTLRGSPTSAGAPLGARSMVVNGSAGATLLPGDPIGVTTTAGSQLLIVRTASGTRSISITFSPPLRGALNPGSAVRWDAPTAEFISTQPDIFVGYVKGGHPGLTLELMEVFL